MISKSPRKTILFLCFCMLALLSQMDFLQAAGTASWYQDQAGYQQAIREKREKDPVLIYFYAPWCHYCKNFEEKVLNRPEVEQALSSVFKVRVNVPENSDLAARFGIHSFPQLRVQMGNPLLIKKINAYPDPKIFLQECRKAGLIP